MSDLPWQERQSVSLIEGIDWERSKEGNRMARMKNVFVNDLKNRCLFAIDGRSLALSFLDFIEETALEHIHLPVSRNMPLGFFRV